MTETTGGNPFGAPPEKKISTEVLRRPGVDKKNIPEEHRKALKGIGTELSPYLQGLCEDLILLPSKSSIESKFELLKSIASEISNLRKEGKANLGKFRHIIDAVSNLERIENNIRSQGDLKKRFAGTREKIAAAMAMKPQPVEQTLVDIDFKNAVSTIENLLLTNLISTSAKNETSITALNHSSRELLRLTEKLLDKSMQDRGARNPADINIFPDENNPATLGRNPAFKPKGTATTKL